LDPVYPCDKLEAMKKLLTVLAALMFTLAVPAYAHADCPPTTQGCTAQNPLPLSVTLYNGETGRYTLATTTLAPGFLVEFFLDGANAGLDATQPYSIVTGVLASGSHHASAVAATSGGLRIYFAVTFTVP